MWRVLRLLFLLGILLLVAGAAAGYALYAHFVRDLPDFSTIADYRPALASEVYASDGRRIGEFFEERRRLTPLAQVPRHVIQAFVSAEDSAFFQHQGIDLVSIARAAWNNLVVKDGGLQGGSTITQQTVKQLLLSPERTYERKIREMILAYRIEQAFDKREILYLYLNQIYFGEGAYGVGEAARTYFGKDVGEISVSEAAQLAGLPKAPSKFSPRHAPEQAERRRRYVLERMRVDGFFADDASYERAVAEKPVLAEAPDRVNFATAAHFTEEVRRTLFEKFGGKLVLEGGLKIETTLDLDRQAAAQAALRKGLEALGRRQGYSGPLRRVAPEDFEAESAALGEKNSALAVGLENLPEAMRADGLVVALDAKQNVATIRFAPGIEGELGIDGARWARPVDPERAPYSIQSLSTALAVGDVARFEITPPQPEIPAAAPPTGADAAAASPAPATPATPLRIELFEEPRVEGALLSVDLASQEVLALVGGYDFARSQFDRVTQARRQPGSAFKPFIYGAALARGYTPASIVHDRPVVYRDEWTGKIWKPENYSRKFYGPITLREALTRSLNNATIHLFRDVGMDEVIHYAQRLGIQSPLGRNMSLSLGSSEVTLLELTRAYAAIGAGGRRVTPIFIRRVIDRDGKVLLENHPLGDPLPPPDPLVLPGTAPIAPALAPGTAPAAEVAAVAPAPDPDPRPRILPAAHAYLLMDMLRAVIFDPNGTGGKLRVLNRPIAGKTGTTNDQADAWFIGFSPEIATGVWVGHDVSQFLGTGETGGRAAAPIWQDYMQVALAPLPVQEFPVPPDIEFARIDRATGLLADASTQSSLLQPFAIGAAPTENLQGARERDEHERILRMDDI